MCPGLGGPSGRRGSASDARACPACACASRARACPWYLSGSRRMALPHLCTQGWGLSGVTRAKPSPRPQTFYSRTSSCPRGGGHMVGVLSALGRNTPPTYASIHLPGALPLEPAICLVRMRDGGRAVANAPCGNWIQPGWGRGVADRKRFRPPGPMPGVLEEDAAGAVIIMTRSGSSRWMPGVSRAVRGRCNCPRRGGQLRRQAAQEVAGGRRPRSRREAYGDA